MKNLPSDEQSLINLAINTSNEKELEKLSKSHFMNVRRAVARNRYCSSSILEELAQDPVRNVSFMAQNNKNYLGEITVLKNERPCVKCQKAESYFVAECVDCINPKIEYKRAN